MLYPLNLAVSLETVMFTLDTIKMCYNMCLDPFSILTVLKMILMK